MNTRDFHRLLFSGKPLFVCAVILMGHMIPTAVAFFEDLYSCDTDPSAVPYLEAGAIFFDYFVLQSIIYGLGEKAVQELGPDREALARVELLFLGSLGAGLCNLASCILTAVAISIDKDALVGHDASCKREYTANAVAIGFAAVNFILNCVCCVGLGLLRSSPEALESLQSLLTNRHEPTGVDTDGQQATAPVMITV